MKKLYSLVALLVATTAFGQFQNGSFEDWDSTFAASYQYELDSTYQIPGATSGWITDWSYDYPFGVCRTTDAYDGNYALMIHNWYGYAYQSVEFKDSLSMFPLFISGHYQYITEALGWSDPQGIAEAFVVDINHDTVGVGSFLFDPVVGYNFFEFPINMSLVPAPLDSIFVRFTNADQSCGGGIICNFLYLDKLQMTSNSQMSIGENNRLRVSTYPNPSTGVLRLETEQIIEKVEAFDHRGSRVDVHFDGETIRLESTGIIYLRFTDREGNSTVERVSVVR